MRYTVILVPGGDTLSVTVPALPGCVSQGPTRAQALTKVRVAIAGWIGSEARQGRQPLEETLAVVSAGVSEALEILEEMREAGEIGPEGGYDLELATVEVLQAVPA